MQKAWIPVIGFLLLAGCSHGEFNDGTVGLLLESTQHRLDGEQVMLNRSQVDCGAQSDLWEVMSMGEDRAVARLSDRARSLGFSDDIQIGEPGLPSPYAQVRGNFSLITLQVGSTRDDGTQGKLVDAKIGVKIDHSCFNSPLPVLMGVRKGRFTQTQNPILRFRRVGSDWSLEEFVH